jgi:hypothetical protein
MTRQDSRRISPGIHRQSQRPSGLGGSTRDSPSPPPRLRVPPHRRRRPPPSRRRQPNVAARRAVPVPPGPASHRTSSAEPHRCGRRPPPDRRPGSTRSRSQHAGDPPPGAIPRKIPQHTPELPRSDVVPILSTAPRRRPPHRLLWTGNGDPPTLFHPPHFGPHARRRQPPSRRRRFVASTRVQ